MPGPATIILAEPDPMFGTMLRVEFSAYGFTVLMAANGTEAFDYARLTEARLVLLDSALAGLDSFEACARIRRSPNHVRTPIVLTVRVHRDRVQAAAAVAGATLVLAKPYAFEDLMQALEAHLPADDPLLSARARRTGMAEGVEWGPLPPLTWPSGSDSALARNARVLPVMRGTGVRVPLIRRR
jgi:DNA-binding response OmpR family regulator